MFSDFPQLVPQKICLSCRGCCRFRDAASPWRPKVARGEIESVSPAADKKILSRAVGGDGYVATVTEAGQPRCTFFHAEDNTCGVYVCRPFECRLYPLLFVKKDAGVVLGVHLSCPYVQETRYSAEFDAYLAAVKMYFARERVAEFVRINSSWVGDYRGFHDEIEELFPLPPGGKGGKA